MDQETEPNAVTTFKTEDTKTLQNSRYVSFRENKSIDSY